MVKSFENTIYALSTPFGQSAIAIFRISGKNCKQIAKKLCGLCNLKSRYVNYSRISDSKSNLIDKGIVIYFKSPESYTGEDLLEIHTHGSIALIKKLTTELSKIKNTRPARPGEFSQRAFYNGKGNMLHYEGINNLIKSETENQLLVANKQIYGKSSYKCTIWREKILEILANVDAEIEFNEEINDNNQPKLVKNIEEILHEVNSTCDSFETTRNLIHGSNVMIIGPVNAGKSSFFNFLLQEEKMIVSKIEGTTLDQSEQSIEIFGCKVNIIDSAGIRITKKSVEKQGIKKTWSSVQSINKFILVLSPDSLKKKYFGQIKQLLAKIKFKSTVIIFNKLDLKNSEEKFQNWEREIPELKNFKSLTISCRKDLLNNNLLKKTHNFIHKYLLTVDTNNDHHYFSEIRQLECLKNVTGELNEALANVRKLEICAKYLRDALNNLDDLYGKHNDEKKLGIIFSNFCIGK